LGAGLVEGETRVVGLLLRDEIAFDEALLSPVEIFCFVHRHARRIALRAGLPDLLGARPRFQAPDGLLLRGGLGLGLPQRKGETFGVQAREQLVCANGIAFPHLDARDPSVGVEGQFDLTDVDISVQGQVGGGLLAVTEIGDSPDGHCDDNHDRQNDPGLHGVFLPTGTSLATNPCASMSSWQSR